jgi:hypothetical protein
VALKAVMSSMVLYWQTLCAAFRHIIRRTTGERWSFTDDIEWAHPLHPEKDEMKPTRLRFSPRAREARLILVIAVLTAWTAIGFAVFPYSSEASSAPTESRPLPILPHTIPSAPVQV